MYTWFCKLFNITKIMNNLETQIFVWEKNSYIHHDTYSIQMPEASDILESIGIKGECSFSRMVQTKICDVFWQKLFMNGLQNSVFVKSHGRT